MSRCTLGKNEEGLLDGKTPTPEKTDPACAICDANSMIMAWLVNTKDEKISANYMCYSTAKDFFDNAVEM